MRYAYGTSAPRFGALSISGREVGQNRRDGKAWWADKTPPNIDHVDLLVLRPSIDPGKLAAEYEDDLPRNLKLLTRALGSKETDTPDIVSFLMFEPHYSRRLVEIGRVENIGLADYQARVTLRVHNGVKLQEDAIREKPARAVDSGSSRTTRQPVTYPVAAAWSAAAPT